MSSFIPIPGSTTPCWEINVRVDHPISITETVILPNVHVSGANDLHQAVVIEGQVIPCGAMPTPGPQDTEA